MVLTDVATGWIKCLPLVVRNGALVIEALAAAMVLFPFPLRGVDFDNNGLFMNEPVVTWCRRKAWRLRYRVRVGPALCRRSPAHKPVPAVVQAAAQDPDRHARHQAPPPTGHSGGSILAHTVVDEAKPRQLQAVSDPVALIAEIHTAQGGLRKRVDRREREPEPLTDIKGFTAGLRIALAHRRATPDASSPYRRRKPIPRRASMLDDLREQIGAW